MLYYKAFITVFFLIILLIRIVYKVYKAECLHLIYKTYHDFIENLHFDYNALKSEIPHIYLKLKNFTIEK